MGKKVNFVKDAKNKSFESAEELKDFMEEYAEECDADFEYLCKMYKYLGGEVEEDESLEGFKGKQREELDEFLTHDDATMKDLREFMEAQRKDLEDFINGDKEECIDLKELVKDAVREVFHEEIDNAINNLNKLSNILEESLKEDK